MSALTSSLRGATLGALVVSGYDIRAECSPIASLQQRLQVWRRTS